MSMTELAAICAWCIDEAGETAQPGDSHGICEEHADQELLTYQWNKLQRVPSYVERFADGRESFEDEQV